MKKKTFWPYGILIAIFIIILACIITIIIASKSPVYEDDYNFESYQNVDENYNAIQASKKAFEGDFKLNPPKASYISKKNKPTYVISKQKPNEFVIKCLSKKSCQALKVQALLTRPHTNKENTKPSFKWKKNELIFSLQPAKLGLYQLLVKLKDEKNAAFYRFYLESK